MRKPVAQGTAGSQPLTALGIEPGYLSLRVLSVYSNLSIRTLRSYLSHSARPLPHYRVGRKVLVKRPEFDLWVSAFREESAPRVDAIVADVLGGL